MWMRQAILATISLLSFSHVSRAGNPIPNFDPYIACWSDPPADTAGWPAGYTKAQYPDAISLCSAVHGRLGHTVGCECASAGSRVECSIDEADPPLFNGIWSNWRTPGGPQTMLNWCQTSCNCLGNGRYNLTNVEESGVPNTNVEPLQVRPPPGATVDTCAGECKVGDQCTSPNCQCQAYSSRWDPSAGVLQYFASCVSPGGIKARDEQMPCPCNGTYVSFACCDAPDGRVWEGPEFRLGELVDGEL